MGQVGNAIEKVGYSHDAMIDLLVANPRITQNAIASYFGYTPPWVSRIMSSDAFKRRLSERRTELVDPVIIASVEEMFEGLVRQGVEVVQTSLTANPDPQVALKAIEIGSRGLGVGGFGQKAAQVQVNTQFVVEVPAKAPDSGGWLEQVRGTPTPVTPEVAPNE